MFGTEEQLGKQVEQSSTRKDVHVMSVDGGWIVNTAGGAETFFETLIQAEEYGEEIASRERARFFVHKENGEIIMQRSYEQDPR